ncbi:MAG: riboflavin synthase [Phycisphaerales bacterium]
MFTGLVQTVGTVALIERLDSGGPNHGAELFIEPPSPPGAAEWHRPFEIGESIAINGCCLTLARVIPRSHHPGQRPRADTSSAASHAGLDVVLGFHAIPETLARTTLGALSPGSRVNLERAATPSSFLGGHIVQGHVDGVARVVSVRTQGEWRVRFAPSDPSLMQYLVPKGSVCVDGVSLTIADLGDDFFEVALIPMTLEKTTLRDLRTGARVNLELDCMAKTIVHWLRHYANR